MDKCHLVDVLSEIREDRRNHLATLTPWSELERGLHQISHCMPKETGRVGEGRAKLLDRFAIGFHEPGFVVPCVDVARPSVDKDPNNALGSSRKMGLARS